MSQDNKIISTLTARELAALMAETGTITVEATTTADDRPVVQASLKVVDPRTGSEIPGGLPFGAVLFKGEGERGCSSVALAARIPAGALGLRLPADFFGRCNERYRFVRAFPMGPEAFVLQMDLHLRGVTREHVKYCLGIWWTALSQVLFDLMARPAAQEAPMEVALDGHAKEPEWTAPAGLLDDAPAQDGQAETPPDVTHTEHIEAADAAVAHAAVDRAAHIEAEAAHPEVHAETHITEVDPEIAVEAEILGQAPHAADAPHETAEAI